MGQEIDNTNFTRADFSEFQKRLEAETALLEQMLKAGKFERTEPVAGYELEAWLIDENGNPSPANEKFLGKLADPEVVAELALFNVELNGMPQTLTGMALSRMQSQLEARWNKCQQTANKMQLDMLAIGTLPTIREHDLCLANMSHLKRYQALNQQVLRLRDGRPINLNISGTESLKLKHDDVMLEAAATSFQIHMQMNAEKAGRYYNIAKIISAPMVAVGANSPYLFEKELWQESRIPLFEQAVSVGGSDYSRRVTFGVRYVEHSIYEVFESNCKRYPVLLAMLMDSPPEKLSHLQLQNGTIWRWNRPLVGFNANGVPHIRLEHRVVPAGPTHLDQMANAAFFFGLITALVQDEKLEQRLSHESVKDNFYAAAKYGMHTEIKWLDSENISLRKLCLDKLVPLAAQGLKQLKIAEQEISKYLEVISARLETMQTGANWQLKWVRKYGKNWQQLVLEYKTRQNTGVPVHSWDI